MQPLYYLLFPAYIVGNFLAVVPRSKIGHFRSHYENSNIVNYQVVIYLSIDIDSFEVRDQFVTRGEDIYIVVEHLHC